MIEDDDDHDTGVTCIKCGKGKYQEVFTEEDIENNVMTPSKYKCNHCKIVLTEKQYILMVMRDNDQISTKDTHIDFGYNPGPDQNDW